MSDSKTDNGESGTGLNTSLSKALLAFAETECQATIQIIFTMQTLIPSTADGKNAKRRLGEYADRLCDKINAVRLANVERQRPDGARRTL